MKNKSILIFQNREMSVFTTNIKHIWNTVNFHTHTHTHIYIYIYDDKILVIQVTWQKEDFEYCHSRMHKVSKNLEGTLKFWTPDI